MQNLQTRLSIPLTGNEDQRTLDRLTDAINAITRDAQHRLAHVLKEILKMPHPAYMVDTGAHAALDLTQPPGPKWSPSPAQMADAADAYARAMPKPSTPSERLTAMELAIKLSIGHDTDEGIVRRARAIEKYLQG